VQRDQRARSAHLSLAEYKGKHRHVQILLRDAQQPRPRNGQRLLRQPLQDGRRMILASYRVFGEGDVQGAGSHVAGNAEQGRQPRRQLIHQLERRAFPGGLQMNRTEAGGARSHLSP
jgi:hypothetical protein